jgi:hypothetical protein
MAKTESLGAGRVPFREVYSLPERCFCLLIRFASI